MDENNKLYLGEIDLKKLKYVIDPYDQKDGFPAVPHNVNIIKSKVDLLIGEEINTSVKPSAYCTSAKASEQINEQKISEITNYMLNSLMSTMSEEGVAQFQQQLQSGEIKDPKEVLGLSGSLTYKSAVEESARTLMEYLYEYLNIKDIFKNVDDDENFVGAEDEFYDAESTPIDKTNNKMILLEHRAYSESQQIADHLKNRNSVVVNLKRVTSDQAKRIIDFLSGCIYAIGGTMQKIGVGIYLCTPKNVNVQGKISEDSKDQDKTEENPEW
jgi:SepF-like predicted cell division protein (DUF552 family)